MRGRRARIIGAPNLSGVGTFRRTDETVKPATLRLLHSVQSYVVDANDTWSTTEYIPRYTKSFVRLVAPSSGIDVQVVVTASNGVDNTFAVVQNGALFGSFTCTADAIRRRVAILGLTPGATVEIWEPINGVEVSQNTGVDRPKSAGYVEGLWLPPSVSTPSRPTTTGTCIVTFGTSIQAACSDRTPQIFDGPLGQLRLLAHAKGWLISSQDMGSGTLLGDGPSMAQRAADVVAAYQASGATSLTVLLGDCRNDWAYYAFAGSVASTPNQCRDGYTALIAAIKASVPSAKIVLCTPIPQTNEADTGGGTLGDYRTAVAAAVGVDVLLDGTSFGIDTGTDLGDGVHMNHLGVAKYVAGISGALDL